MFQYKYVQYLELGLESKHWYNQAGKIMIPWSIFVDVYKSLKTIQFFIKYITFFFFFWLKFSIEVIYWYIMVNILKKN